ncbi:MAG: hypothetical protein PUB51_07960 [Oscillospiraceae bacterium]|nr:hypothetical protein [Oscillospiraceae bacterium]
MSEQRKKPFFGKVTGPVKGGSLPVLTLCFLLGAVLGLGFHFWSGENPALSGFLTDYLEYAAQGDLRFSLPGVIWRCVRWPLLIVLSGTVGAGVALVPAALFLRGFLLSYAVSGFSAQYGGRGMAAAAALFAVTIFIELPILFAAGCESVRMSRARLSGTAGTGWKPEFLLPAAGGVILAAAIRWTVSPALITAVCSRLF